MSGRSDRSAVRALHRLVEHYTPDGALGRTLLGGPALLAAPVLFLGGATTLSSATAFPVFALGLLAFVVSVPAFFVGLLALWPVYLSLIGNVESPSAYPTVRPGRTDGARTRRPS